MDYINNVMEADKIEVYDVMFRKSPRSPNIFISKNDFLHHGYCLLNINNETHEITANGKFKCKEFCNSFLHGDFALHLEDKHGTYTIPIIIDSFEKGCVYFSSHDYI